VLVTAKTNSRQLLKKMQMVSIDLTMKCGLVFNILLVSVGNYSNFA
jgi:hypothetical protein